MPKKKPVQEAVPVPVDEDAMYVVTEVDADDLIASHHVCRGITAARKLALAICEECFGPLGRRKRRMVREALESGQYLENRGNGGCAVNIDVLDPPRNHTLALLTMPELATVLAALRHWQVRPGERRVYFKDIATDCGKFPALNTSAIDKLRRRLNGDSHARS